MNNPAVMGLAAAQRTITEDDFDQLVSSNKGTKVIKLSDFNENNLRGINMPISPEISYLNSTTEAPYPLDLIVDTDDVLGDYLPDTTSSNLENLVHNSNDQKLNGMELSENKGPLRNQIRDYQVEYQKGSDAAFNPNYGSTNVNRSAGESNAIPYTQSLLRDQFTAIAESYPSNERAQKGVTFAESIVEYAISPDGSQQGMENHDGEKRVPLTQTSRDQIRPPTFASRASSLPSQKNISLEKDQIPLRGDSMALRPPPLQYEQKTNLDRSNFPQRFNSLSNASEPIPARKELLLTSRDQSLASPAQLELQTQPATHIVQQGKEKSQQESGDRQFSNLEIQMAQEITILRERLANISEQNTKLKKQMEDQKISFDKLSSQAYKKIKDLLTDRTVMTIEINSLKTQMEAMEEQYQNWTNKPN